MSSRTQNKISRLKSAGFFLFIAALVFPHPGQAASVKESVRQGNRLYGQGKFVDSLKRYQDALNKEPESDIVNFNAGTALYKQRQYEEAIDHFQKAILSDDASLRERAYYNLGNSFYKSGIGREKSDIAAAVTSLRESLRHLASALALDKKDQDAQYNYDFVNKELERLREEQQQPRQNQDGQKDQEQPQDSPSGEEQPGAKDGQAEQPRSDAQRSDQEENSPQSGSGEAQEQKSQETEQPAGSVSGQELTHSAPQSGALRVNPEQVEGLTKSEAERLLQNYQQTEEPQGLLHVFKEKHETGAVIKDW